jgi:hypothetical protein
MQVGGCNAEKHVEGEVLYLMHNVNMPEVLKRRDGMLFLTESQQIASSLE